MLAQKLHSRFPQPVTAPEVFPFPHSSTNKPSHSSNHILHEEFARNWLWLFSFSIKCFRVPERSWTIGKLCEVIYAAATTYTIFHSIIWYLRLEKEKAFHFCSDWHKVCQPVWPGLESVVSVSVGDQPQFVDCVLLSNHKDIIIKIHGEHAARRLTLGVLLKQVWQFSQLFITGWT